jgi:hypothetical protein
LKSKEKGSNLADRISAQGANEFTVKGFGSKQKLNNHWKNGRTHKEEYIADQQRAVDLIQKPCRNGIWGYKTRRGKICRYDEAKNDFVIGRPDRGIYTMFKPIKGKKYFLGL